MADPLRHRQTKGAETDMVDLRPPRHIPTLPVCDTRQSRLNGSSRPLTAVQQEWAEGPLTLEPNRSRASMPAKSASTRIATFSAFLPELLSGAPAPVFAAFERAAYTVTKGEIIKFRSYKAHIPRGAPTLVTYGRRLIECSS
jgi:hypothetical protein